MGSRLRGDDVLGQLAEKKALPRQCFRVRGRAAQYMCCPPLIAMFAPVTNAASSLDR